MTRPEIKEAYRAIGRYVYCFSRLIFFMRSEVESALGDQLLAQIATGEMTAHPIANAFFGICDGRYEANADDKKIAGKLQNAVNEAIRTRNDVAHGDWWVAWINDDGTVAPPRLARVRPSAKRERRFSYRYDLDRLSDELEELRNLVYEYGGRAGGMFWRLEGRRPSDILAIENGKVVRAGPYAEGTIVITS